mgnify:CR=1 FL=1
MRTLSGARELRLVRAGRILLWVMAAVFLGTALVQGRGPVRLWEGRGAWTPPAGAQEGEDERKPKPPPDPYPDMRLMDTILGNGGNYALIRVRRGTKKMLREGDSFQDIRVVEVREDGATVEVKGQQKELRITGKSHGNTR